MNQLSLIPVCEVHGCLKSRVGIKSPRWSCPICSTERARDWRHANPERAAAQSRKASRKERQVNPEKVNATKRKSQRKHPEAKAACDARGTKKYRNRHPEKVTEANHRRRALKLNATVPNRPVTAAVQRERKALFDGCCFCGSKGKLTLEHMVPLSRGGLHVPENLLGSCNSCNCKKNNNPVEDWFRSQPFFSEQRWQRLLEVTLLQEASKKKDEANMGAFTKRAV